MVMTVGSGNDDRVQSQGHEQAQYYLNLPSAFTPGTHHHSHLYYISFLAQVTQPTTTTVRNTALTFFQNSIQIMNEYSL